MVSALMVIGTPRGSGRGGQGKGTHGCATDAPPYSRSCEARIVRFAPRDHMLKCQRLMALAALAAFAVFLFAGSGQARGHPLVGLREWFCVSGIVGRTGSTTPMSLGNIRRIMGGTSTAPMAETPDLQRLF